MQSREHRNLQNFLHDTLNYLPLVVSSPKLWFGGKFTPREVVVVVDTYIHSLTYFHRHRQGLHEFWGYYNQKTGRPLVVASLNPPDNWDKAKPEIESYVNIFKEWWEASQKEKPLVSIF